MFSTPTPFLSLAIYLILAINTLSAHASSNLALAITDSEASHDKLASRQTTTNVPRECRTLCDPVNRQIAEGCRPGQCCTQPFLDTYAECYRCMAAGWQILDHRPGQATLSNIVQQCQQRVGITLQEPALPSSGAITWTAPEASQSTTGTSTSSTTTSLPSSSPSPSTTSASQITIRPGDLTTTEMTSTTREQQTTRPSTSAAEGSSTSESPPQSASASQSRPILIGTLLATFFL